MSQKGDASARREWHGRGPPVDRIAGSYTVEVLGLVTADVARDLDPDLVPFDAACRRLLGEDAVRIVSWDDPTVEWHRFDAVVVRSTWDYPERLDEFLDWVDTVAQATRLINPADAIRWSADKRYLTALRDAGIAIAPTVFVAPGSPTPQVGGLHVVKPAVGAGSSGAQRCLDGEVAAHVAVLHADGRTAMVQPYLELLDDRGETSMCFVPGTGPSGLDLSHTFRKGAILTSTDVEQEGGLFAKEEIAPRTPTPAEVALAESVLSSTAVAGFDLSFARIDVAPFRQPDGTELPVVMEVELIEPSFYLATSPPAAELFAQRLVARVTAMA